MATGSKLILRFGTAAGEKNFTYNYGNASAPVSDVKDLMNAMIENGDIFKYPPLTAISAKTQVTTESEFDLSD